MHLVLVKHSRCRPKFLSSCVPCVEKVRHPQEELTVVFQELLAVRYWATPRKGSALNPVRLWDLNHSREEVSTLQIPHVFLEGYFKVLNKDRVKNGNKGREQNHHLVKVSGWNIHSGDRRGDLRSHLLPPCEHSNQPLGGVFLSPKYLANCLWFHQWSIFYQHPCPNRLKPYTSIPFSCVPYSGEFPSTSKEAWKVGAVVSHILSVRVCAYAALHALARPRVLLHGSCRPTPSCSVLWLIFQLGLGFPCHGSWVCRIQGQRIVHTWVLPQYSSDSLRLLLSTRKWEAPAHTTAQEKPPTEEVSVGVQQGTGLRQYSVLQESTKGKH